MEHIDHEMFSVSFCSINMFLDLDVALFQHLRLITENTQKVN